MASGCLELAFVCQSFLADQRGPLRRKTSHQAINGRFGYAAFAVTRFVIYGSGAAGRTDNPWEPGNRTNGNQVALCSDL